MLIHLPLLGLSACPSNGWPRFRGEYKRHPHSSAQAKNTLFLDMRKVYGLLAGLCLVAITTAAPTQIPLNRQSCPTYDGRLRPPSASVHELHIHDIKVVSALGDSMTAGFGATMGIAAIPLENRGVSPWSSTFGCVQKHALQAHT